MNIIPKLNLNKHKRDSENLSFVNAHNVKVSHDESCVVNEESIRENVYIHNYLSGYYESAGTTYKIVGVIPCNNELVLIVKPGNTETDADIFRYREQINNNIEGMYCAYGGVLNPNRFKYSGGEIKGAFTYNVENSLIVAISEYNVIGSRIPLRTINLGNFYNENDVYRDYELSNDKLSISPEVKLPKVNNLDYIAGSAYKGWYYIFIRYKINTVDYTQWYSIGAPIYIDTLEQYQLIRYAYNRDTKFGDSVLNQIVYPKFPYDGYGAGCSDYFSNGSDIANETFKVDLMFYGGIQYEKYQIGVICGSKAYTKAFRTADIFLDNYTEVSGFKVQEYTLDNKSLVEYNTIDLISDNFNYFNVKNIINYKNRLYISNYEEDNANNKNIPESIINNINVSLINLNIRDFGLVYDIALLGDGSQNQYDAYSLTVIPLHVYLKVSEETLVTITAASHPSKTAKAGQFYIVSNYITPGFAYIELREPGGLGTVIKTNYGKAPNQTNVYLTLYNKDGDLTTNIILDTNKIALNGGMQYINTNISFKDRKKESTLIPGEIYNFFIHFTNKYNHSTNGYRIQNNTIWDTEDGVGVEIIPVPFSINILGTSYTYYAGVPVDNNVSILDTNYNSNYAINITNIKFYKNFTGTRLYNKISLSEETDVLKAFKEYFYSYANDKFVNTKWYQITYGPGDNNFHLFINNNGERLFKVPIVESFSPGWDGFPQEVDDFKTYNTHALIKASFNNIEIPEGYDGYYISYEKYEAQRRVTGLLTRNDFRSQDYVISGEIRAIVGTLNNKKSDKMFFYSSIYDISDTIKLDYNIMRIEGVNIFKKEDIPDWDYMQRNINFGFAHDMNKPQIGTYSDGVQKTYSIPEYKIAVADSAADSRMGLGTALQITDAYNLFPNYDTDNVNNDKIKLYRVTLLNTTRDVYMSNNKNLVRLTDVNYRLVGYPTDYKYSTGYIKDGYNGHYTYDGILIYENAGVSFNSATNKVTRFVHNNEYYQSEVPNILSHTYQNDIPFAAYLQIPICMDVFLESKSFKKAPKGVIYVATTTDEFNTFAKGSMVTPADSIDLFENRQGSADDFNPKTYTNYRDDLVSIEIFDKTIRRSNIIQDESRSNSWRTFPIEGYKNISENKGKVTNIVGVGVVLLVHTEHSLFMFNTDSTLKTRDQDIQLTQPDAFEVDYKEVFTSDKGFGGLQNDKSWLLDQFGYIFYSEDTNRIYLFDNNSLDYLDSDIIEWLFKYKPYNVRMANDKSNNRILMRFTYNVGDVIKFTIISYSYKAKYFVSQHDYYFDEGFNTKTNLYLKCNNDHNGCSLHNFIDSGIDYGSYDNILGSFGIPTVRPSKISIIINNNYNTVKFLEYITYKLIKYKNDTAIDFTNLPVEEYIEPFAGNTLIVYNDNINTGLLDINVNEEILKNVFGNFDKPYWDLGVWNYSYLRNNISNLNNGASAINMSRLFGNYFIIEFTFDNIDSRRVEFEEINYSISE